MGTVQQAGLAWPSLSAQVAVGALPTHQVPRWLDHSKHSCVRWLGSGASLLAQVIHLHSLSISEGLSAGRMPRGGQDGLAPSAYVKFYPNDVL